MILASHLGTLKGMVVPELSLKPVANRLGQMLNVSAVKFPGAVVGELVQRALTDLKSGEVLLLENLRFEREEEANDPTFSKQVTSLTDLDVNDTFDTMHRPMRRPTERLNCFQIGWQDFSWTKKWRS